MDFYRNLFTTSRPKHLEEVVNFIPEVVTVEMNADITGDFTTMEVEAVLKQMAPLKAPEPMVCLPYSIKIIGLYLVMMLHNLFCTIETRVLYLLPLVTLLLL